MDVAARLGELDALAAQVRSADPAGVASALFAAGLQKGDRIAWIGKNSDLYFILFYGAARAGIVLRQGLTAGRVLAGLLMFHVTCVGWLIFRARSGGQIGRLASELATGCT